MEPFFVYVLEGRHRWRFVFHAEAARDGGEAIDQALAEARAMGHAGAGDYLAVPASAITTRTVEGSLDPTSS